MKLSSLIAFALPTGLALGATIPSQLAQRQSQSNTFGSVIQHDIERFRVDLSLLQAGLASYNGFDLGGAQRIINNLLDLSATLEQATDDANTYAGTFTTPAQQEADSQTVVAAVNDVVPYVHSAITTLIQKRAALEQTPFGPGPANLVIQSNLDTILRDVNDLENAMEGAVSYDQVTNLENAFLPIVSDITRAKNYYSQ
jgi:hypothetical protein